MVADPILVLAFVISVGLVAIRLMLIGLRDNVQDEDGPTLDVQNHRGDD